MDSPLPHVLQKLTSLSQPKAPSSFSDSTEVQKNRIDLVQSMMTSLNQEPKTVRDLPPSVQAESRKTKPSRKTLSSRHKRQHRVEQRKDAVLNSTGALSQPHRNRFNTAESSVGFFHGASYSDILHLTTSPYASGTHHVPSASQFRPFIIGSESLSSTRVVMSSCQCICSTAVPQHAPLHVSARRAIQCSSGSSPLDYTRLLPAIHSVSKRGVFAEPVVDDHFRRSLGGAYDRLQESAALTRSLDEHFMKALGPSWGHAKWNGSVMSASAAAQFRLGQNSDPGI